MSAIPHLPRPRLVDRLAPHRVSVLEAGGGTGKTSLGMELADRLGLVPVRAQLPPGWSRLPSLAALINGALTSLGFPTAASAAIGASSAGELHAALDAVPGGAVLLVDDVQHGDEELIASLDELAWTMGPEHRLVVAGRRLPRSVEAATIHLHDDELAFTEDETAELMALAGLSSDTPGLAAEVHAVCDGWVAPTVGALGTPTAARRAGHVWRNVRDLVAEVIDALPPDTRAVLGTAARLPRLHPTVLAAAGVEAHVRAGIDLGVPVRHLGSEWFALADPFSAAVVSETTVDHALLYRLCLALAQEGDALLAAAVIGREYAGEARDERIASMLAELEPDSVLRIHGAELVELALGLDDRAVAAHPRGLLVASRVASLTGRAAAKQELLDRLRHLEDDAVAPVVEAEELLARAWMQADEPVTLLTRGRALTLQHPENPEVGARVAELEARLAAFEPDITLGDAIAAWERCAGEWEQAGHRVQAAAVLVGAAVNACFADAAYDRAIPLLDRAVTSAGGSPPVLLLALVYRAMVLIDVGRDDEAEASLDRAEPIAQALGAGSRLASIEWFRARLAAQRGDGPATMAAIRRAEGHDEIDTAGGAFFAADAATMLARVGLRAEAEDRLTRALDGDPGTTASVPLAALDAAARRGAVEDATSWYEVVEARGGADLRERWRARLLLAHAADLAGDDRRDAWAADAFEQAALLGHPELPFVREPSIARSLLPVAAAAGSRAAAALLRDGVVEVRLLGGFRVVVPGLPEVVPAGMQAQALKYLAVSGGRAQAEGMIEALWPDSDPERGRQRLRVVLSRLRSDAGELVVREGDVVVLAPGTVVDAVRFDDLAQRALVEHDLGLAEAAVALYRGRLLPDDPYLEWASAERDRLAWRFVMLLDRLAAAAAEEGDLDRAVSLLTLAIDEEPLDEDRYVLAADLLAQQLRTGAARALLERAIRTLEREGIAPSSAVLHRLDEPRL